MFERIRSLRQALNLSQTDFAKKMGMTRSMVSNMELGLIDIPDYKLEIISKAFNANLKWLRTGEGEMFNPVMESLDALAEANQIDELTRAVVITLLEMPKAQREAFTNLVANVANKVRKADQEEATAMALDAAITFGAFNAARAENPPEEDQPAEPHTV